MCTEMKNCMLLIACWLLQSAASATTQPRYEDYLEEMNSNTPRERRGVIEEEKYHNTRTDSRFEGIQPKPWVPGPLPPEDPTTKVSLAMDEAPLFQTTERTTDKPTSRGARASNENWIKLPFPGRVDDANEILTPPKPSGELVNSRMPRVNFVTQNKALETSESRNDKEFIQRSSRTEDRADFVRPDEEKNVKPVYPRQAVYYPDESRRAYYDERSYYPDDLYRRDPQYDLYDRRRYNPGYPGPRLDRYDEQYDNYIPRKPKRIIYYAHLPEVVRTPPSVDLRYRYSADPYRRYEDDIGTRSGRFDYRFRNRYPYPPYPYQPYRKEDRIYRDLAHAGTVAKEKKTDEKITPTPIMPKKEEKSKTSSDNMLRNQQKNLINSHQYHDSMDMHYDPLSKNYQDLRPDDSYLRYDEPLFHSAVDDPYRNN